MKYIISIIFLLLSNSIFSAPTCSKNGTTVIYTNGVITPRENAELAKEKIKFLNLNSQLDLKPEKVRYILAYNYSESLSLDVMESAVQKLPQSYIDELKVTNAYEAYSYFLQGKLISSISSAIIDSINQSKLEMIRSFAVDYHNDPLYSKTISEINNHYQSTFSRGERLFAISHSQGSLFMKDAWNLLPEGDNKRKYFSGFQIASVLGSEMSSHFGYATHEKDAVVNLVRGAIGALPANLETPFFVNSGFDDDILLNHGILSTYLNDSTIKPQVISRLIATAQLLESNCLKAVINYTKNNLVVNFDSTDPEDPDVKDLTYSWYFGDGQTVNTTSKTISHTFLKDGQYQVDLTVTNNAGISVRTLKTIEVRNNANVPLNICNGGIYISTINFYVEDGQSGSVSYSSAPGPKPCECATVYLPLNTYINIHVDGIGYLGDPIALTPFDYRWYLHSSNYYANPKVFLTFVTRARHDNGWRLDVTNGTPQFCQLDN